MKRTLRQSCLRTSALLAALLTCADAGASLGGMAASIPADAAQARGSVHVLARSGFQLHEITLPSGSSLREFADADGKVFAVAWSGPAAPDLRLALGKYFDAYVAAAKNTAHRNHSRLDVSADGLVVQSSGHPRALAGRAYLPSAVPSGVSLDDIR